MRLVLLDELMKQLLFVWPFVLKNFNQTAPHPEVADTYRNTI